MAGPEPSETLAGIGLLAGLPADELRALERRCRWRRHRAGEQVIDRYSLTRDVFFVALGRLQVVSFAASGRQVLYAAIEAGDCFGELSAIDGEPRSATVVAAEDCLLARLSPDRFNDLLLRHPPLALTMLRRLARIIRATDRRIHELSTLGSVQRVYRLLLELAERSAGDPRVWAIKPRPTQQQIAARIGATRETVARTLSQLTAAGIVRRADRRLLILDRTALELLADDEVRHDPRSRPETADARLPTR